MCYQYRKSHCGDNTTVLSPEWDFLYLRDDTFILNRGTIHNFQRKQNQTMYEQRNNFIKCPVNVYCILLIARNLPSDLLYKEGLGHSGPRFYIKTVLPRYGDAHVKNKTVVRPSYFFDMRGSYTGVTTSLYWNGSLVVSASYHEILIFLETKVLTAKMAKMTIFVYFQQYCNYPAWHHEKCLGYA